MASFGVAVPEASKVATGAEPDLGRHALRLQDGFMVVFSLHSLCWSVESRWNWYSVIVWYTRCNMLSTCQYDKIYKEVVGAL